MLHFKLKIAKNIIFLFRMIAAPSSGRGDKKMSVFSKQNVKTAFHNSKWQKNCFFPTLSQN